MKNYTTQYVSEEETGSNDLPFESAEEEEARLAPYRLQVAESYAIVMELCRQANAPEAVRNLVDALIRLSNGRIQFKASDWEVADVHFENKDMKSALKKKVQRWRKRLVDWQTESNITLVQTKPGHLKFNHDREGNAVPENVPCEYRLIVLDLAAKALSSGLSIEAAARKVLSELPVLPSQFGETRTRKWTSARAHKSAMTYIAKTVELGRTEGFGKEVIKDLKEEIDTYFSELDKQSETNSSQVEDESGTNDYTINTPYNNSSIFYDSKCSNNSYGTNNILSTKVPLKEKSMMDKANELASLGFRVFPVHTVVDEVCSCRHGSKCSSKAKHPRIDAFQLNATTDTEQIKQWWRKWRNANIGILTGEYDNRNVVALDVDPKHGGYESLENLVKEFGQLPETLTAITGGEGRHYMFFVPCGVRVPNLQASEKLGAGLDIRGAGGFIVGAGSLHASGNQYRWEDANKPIAAMPKWMVPMVESQPVLDKDSVKPNANEKPKVKTVIAVVPFTNHGQSTNVTVAEGRRNKFLFVKAIGLFHNGYQKAEVDRRVTNWNQKACVPPVSTEELSKLVESAQKTCHRT